MLITSLDAALQRVPPLPVIKSSRYELKVGEQFNRAAFEMFVRSTGYALEGVADEPGELAIRDEVIDIFPAGGAFPMRIVLSQDGSVTEIRSYNAETQRTDAILESIVFGPASEAIPTDSRAEDDTPADRIERSLLRLYEVMPSVFEIIGQCPIVFEPGWEERVEEYLDLIADARRTQEKIGRVEHPARRSIYLERVEWIGELQTLSQVNLDLSGGDAILGANSDDLRRKLAELCAEGMQNGRKVVVAGRGRPLEALCRRIVKAAGQNFSVVAGWENILRARSGSFLKLEGDLEDGFVDNIQDIILVAAGNDTTASVVDAPILAEPELRIGDVVVHEDHGVGLLAGLEQIDIEASVRDAARLEYYNGASLLLPTEEFGKLWRYGSDPDAVKLDRLHTDAWDKKKAQIAKDIGSAARHLLKAAKGRHTARAETFVPPRSAYAQFVRRFPYIETVDQTRATKAVLSDLASGKVMNRLICGDVGFGKTEIALRAAAAVAHAGGQVVIIAPTTVLARQHFMTFERRFAETGVAVAMLSRLVSLSEAKRVKAGLADGEIGIVVATQAILAKDVTFARLGLLIVDEEHRFGLRDKRAMSALASSLHTLTMSATPIPRTLQSAMVGIQDVNVLRTAPSKRRPVRTFLSTFDRAAMRSALMREFRRGGQSFLVVPRIEDIDEIEAIFSRLVPELKFQIAHGKMPTAEMDEAIVGFSDGRGDILLSTNIIENGIDVPRANTIFIWRADLFGLSQLHQLRGRVGRGRAQGFAYFLTGDDNESREAAHARLSTLVEQDRLGSGLAISMRDLDLRGGGDVVGDNQSGHVRAIGIGLYQNLLGKALSRIRKETAKNFTRAVVNVGATGSIPEDYVSDAAVRLNLHARLLRATSVTEVDGLEEEFDDRFGELPEDASILLRLHRLQIAAGRRGISRVDAGPKALAITFTSGTSAKVIATLSKKMGAHPREDRIVVEQSTATGEKRLAFFEGFL
ncbi:helicase-related protein (plasmid) [Aliirhizobium terrae]|uniref:DEAD/DEAH box helicase n=1 Tax=Terrirhizobium terrae TaxID=2926709 RepID=UPI0025771DC6|nr:DEAD/DEAH box helicase [Rhizobium sp. CC-CFT758]WJH38437.1 helicase-related protein [Rhizobium sp. CC-CFT758]